MMEDRISDLVKKVQSFCEDRDWDQFHNPKDLAIGLSTEANELLDIFRFKTEEQMKKQFEDEKTIIHIQEELADVLFFLLRFAQMNNIDLAQCLDDKLIKNEMKYPIAQSKGKNQKYNEI